MAVTPVDEALIHKTFTMAEQARSYVSPDPLVGALVVNQGKIVGQGVHVERFTPHAEAVAMEAAGPAAEGATLYISLEPCGHQGKHPACVDHIIAAGIKRVVFSIYDTNPKVKQAGGLDRLKAAGIEVVGGVLEKEGRTFNDGFLKHIVTGTPFVAAKWAMTLDGKIASRTRQSQWITGPDALRYAHRLRRRYDAILVGVGTILQDDPQLTIRLESQGSFRRGKFQPDRIVLDTHARIPLTARVLEDNGARVWVAVGEAADPERIKRLSEKANVILLPCDPSGRLVDWHELLRQLGNQQVCSVLIEGGSEVHGTALDAGVVDKFYAFIAPKIIGGHAALSPVGGVGVPTMDRVFHLEQTNIEVLGEDLLVQGYTKASQLVQQDVDTVLMRDRTLLKALRGA